MDKNRDTFLYFLKNRLRIKEAVFWMILYPLILVSIFYFGFSGLMNESNEPIRPIPVAVEKDYPYRFVLKQVGIFDEVIAEESEAESLLLQEKVTAFIRKDGSLLFLKSGISQTVVKEVADRIKQTEAFAKSGVSITKLADRTSYVKRLQQKEDHWKLTFYAAVGMVSLYSIYGGIRVVSQDDFTARIVLSPLKKSVRLAIYFIIEVILNLAVNLVLIFYIDYVLKLNLFPNILGSMALIGFGNFVGISLGILLGIPKKISMGAKQGIATAITLLLAFFSGMMGRGMPAIIRQTIPWFEKLNPIAVVSGNLMRLNMLSSSSGYVQAVLILVIQTAIFLFVGWFILKNRKCEYD